MSLKDEVKFVKEELSSDEKVLESAFKLEGAYKKYKKVIWGVAIVALAAVITKNGMEMVEQSRLEAANQALLTLQQQPDNKEALATLQAKNPALYEIYTLSVAAQKEDTATLKSLANSQNEVVADMSRYTASVIEKAPKDSKYYEDLAYLEEAYAALQKGDKERAKQKLSMIDLESPVANLAKLLKHMTIKAAQ